jgi:hypothetical protein
MRSFNTNDINKTTDLVQYAARLSQNTSSANVEVIKNMIQDRYKRLIQKHFSNESSTTILTVGDKQDYPLPFDYSKLKTGTLTIGNLKWTPTEILSRMDWDRLNTITNYYSDIPNNFFIWNGNFSLWPTPSTGSTALTYTTLVGTLTAGNTITAGSATGSILTSSSTVIQVAVSSETAFSTGSFTTSNGATGTITATAITVGNTISFNYKRRVTDLTFADYTTGTLTATNDSSTITGLGTGFVANYLPSAGNVFNLNLWLKITPPSGDGNWYQINSLDSATGLTLVNKYNGLSTSGATFVIGQMPLLLEDFHDLIVFDVLRTYFSTIVDNPEKKEEFDEAFNEGIEKMNEYVGTKSLNINLRGAINTINPNLHQQNIGGNA